MKIRNGFVSNSSSSSFICDVCEEEVSGWDAGYRDFDMTQCQGGHIFCDGHVEDNLDDRLKKILTREYIIKNDMQCGLDIKSMDEGQFEEFLKNEFEDNYGYELRYDEYPTEICPICTMEIFVKEDLVSYLVKKTGVTKSEVFMEVKKENKRRKKLYLCEYIDYVKKNKGIDMDSISKEVKEKFKTYEEFYNYIN